MDDKKREAAKVNAFNKAMDAVKDLPWEDARKVLRALLVFFEDK